MKFVSATLCLLFFVVSTVHAQDCPTTGILSTSNQSLTPLQKHQAAANDFIAGAASDLPIDQRIACTMGDSFVPAALIKADGPVSTELEEIWLGNSWNPNSKSENEYNDDDQLTSRLLLRWNSGLQDYVEQTATFYSNPTANSSEVLTQTWNGSAFENQYLSYFESDASDNVVKIERFDWEDGAWKTRFLATSVVENGLLMETTIQTTHDTGTLANAILRTFAYDAEGRKTVEIEEDWDASSQSWVLESQDLITYNGSTIVTLSQVYEAGAWVDYVETTMVIDSNDLLLEQVSIPLKQGAFGIRFSYTYDSAGNLTEVVSQGDDGAGGWINQSRNAFTLDADGDPLEFLFQTFDPGSMAWVNSNRVTYQYEQNEKSTSIEEELPLGLASFDLYPYPAQDRVQVELELTQASELQVDVFDILGRRVANLTEGTAPAGIQQLSWLPQNEPAGLYFVRLSVDGAIDTKTIVIVK